MTNETPKEKAERLGVPLKHTPPIIPEQKPNPLQQSEKSFAERMKSLLSLTVSVCETCNKELTRSQERPCGNMFCPFGHLIN